MSVVRVGSTKKFADNWDNIFGGGKVVRMKTASARSAKKAAHAKAPAPKAAKAKAPKSVAAKPLVKKKNPTQPAGPGATNGVGREKAKKSAAKRKSATRKRRVASELMQKELF
jgi:hypothetical protein